MFKISGGTSAGKTMTPMEWETFMNRHQRILLDCGVQHSVTVKQRVDTFKKTGRLPILNRYTEPGRNDPCPCESGKKYKHCCIDKNRRNVGVANFIANQ